MQRVKGPPGQGAADGFDAVAGGFVHVLCFVIEAGEQPFAQRGERFGDAGQRSGQPVGGLRSILVQRKNVTLHGAHALPGVRAASARQNLAADQAQEGFGRIGTGGFDGIEFRALFVHAACPIGRGQRYGGLQSGVERHFERGTIGYQVLKPLAQAAGAGPSTFSAAQPAAQLGGFSTRERGREGAVGGAEHVVAFVEYVAGGHGVVVQPAPRGLGHHQSVVGDDEIGGARAPDCVLDEAAAPMRARGMDAFAAAVGQRGDQGPAEQLRQPAGQVAALDVAVVGRHGPTGDQAQRDDILVHEAAGSCGYGVFQVQQTEVVLAAFADHDAAAAFGGIGDQAFQFAVDLALQVARESADPDGAFILLRPDAGGCQVAEGLAGAGTSLDQDHVWIAADFPWRESGGGGAGVIPLPRPLFGVRTEHGGETQAGFGFRDGVGGRRRLRGGIFPVRQFLPDLQRLV